MRAEFCVGANAKDEEAPLPCPFCGSDDLDGSGLWCFDDGEREAWECTQCFAGAPKEIWNRRTPPQE